MDTKVLNIYYIFMELWKFSLKSLFCAHTNLDISQTIVAYGKKSSSYHRLNLEYARTKESSKLFVQIA